MTSGTVRRENLDSHWSTPLLLSAIGLLIALKHRYSQPFGDLEKISAVHISLLDYLE